MKEGLIESIQSELRVQGLDGWFFTSFRASNPIAEMLVRDNSAAFTTRRWFYFIPAQGEPVKLLHNIEPHSLDSAPGREVFYSRWQDWQEELRKALKGAKKIAAEYSPDGVIPAISRLDLGVGELISSLGIELVCSGDLVAKFTVTMTKEQYESHLRALDILERSIDYGFTLVKGSISSGKPIDEYTLQQNLLTFLEEHSLVTSSAPIAAVNANAADPHFEPKKEGSAVIKKGDVLLIDIWAKEKGEESIFADITWCGYVGKEVPPEVEKLFEIVMSARDAGIAKAQECGNRAVQGWEVDRAARDVIEKAGYGEFFPHRTGHSIFTEDHADGANMDDFETRDERRLLKGTMFSIEPGIYLKGKIGFRSEVNVFISEKGAVVTGKKQEKLTRILG
jgi:Xaa-Pro dipeptidase